MEEGWYWFIKICEHSNLELVERIRATREEFFESVLEHLFTYSLRLDLQKFKSLTTGHRSIPRIRNIRQAMSIRTQKDDTRVTASKWVGCVIHQWLTQQHAK